MGPSQRLSRRIIAIIPVIFTRSCLRARHFHRYAILAEGALISTSKLAASVCIKSNKLSRILIRVSIIRTL